MCSHYPLSGQDGGASFLGRIVGGVCVEPLEPQGIRWFSTEGAQAHRGYLCQRSCSRMGEAEIDHLRVPAETCGVE